MNSPLNIHAPIVGISQKTQFTDISFLIEEEQNLWSLTYHVPSTFSEYVTTEVADACVVALLMYAMKKGYDIHSTLPVSDNLLMKLNKYLIPFLNRINPSLHPIKIIAHPYSGIFKGCHTGTGISCGVDSLSTVVYHGMDEIIPAYKIDTLTLLNTGYYGTSEENSERYRKYLKRSILFCENNGYSFLSVDTNVSNQTHYDFLSAHTYLTCSTILLFQKYFHNYFYASGYPVFNFEANFKDPAYYDTFLLECISTRSLRFTSACCTMSRVQKTRLIAEHLDIFKFLYVCFAGNPEKNCSRCEKCVRTMLALEALGMRERIGEIFEEDIYNKNRILYMSYMLRHRRKNVFYQEIYDEMRHNHIPIPLLAYTNPVPCRFEARQWLSSFAKTPFGHWLKMVVTRYDKAHLLF